MRGNTALLVADVPLFVTWMTEYQGYVSLPPVGVWQVMAVMTGNGNVDDNGKAIDRSHLFVIRRPRRGDVAETPDRNLSKYIARFNAAKDAAAKSLTVTGRLSRSEPEMQGLYSHGGHQRPKLPVPDMDWSKIEERVAQHLRRPKPNDDGLDV